MVRASRLPVQQQNTASTATTTRYDPRVGGLPSAWFALRAGRRGCGPKRRHLDQSSRTSSREERERAALEGVNEGCEKVVDATES